MIQFITLLGNLLRGKDYFGDFLKTIIIGFICYIIGFLIISIKIVAFAPKGFDGQGIAIIYYMILMPIVLIPIMGVYFFLLFVIRFFFPQKTN